MTARSNQFRSGIEEGPLDPFTGYKNAIDEQLEDATAVLDAFHIVKLGIAAVDEVRHSIQEDTLGHRVRKGDPLYGTRRVLQSGAENLTANQSWRLEWVITPDPRREEAFLAYQCTQELRAAYQHEDLKAGRRIAQKVLDTFLAYFTNGRANNGGTEAINGFIERARRVARGFRNRQNHRLHMLLIGAGLDGHLPT